MKLEYNKDMQKNKFKMFNLACLVLSVIFVLGILWLWKINNNDNKSKNTKADKLIVQFDQLKKISNINIENTNDDIPKEINLLVPFTSQAPLKDWNQPWQDACEEAVVLMFDAYYKEYNLSPLFARDEIIKMVDWEQKKDWGVSIEIEKIKRIIASGNIVLTVADGKVLPNPNFRNGGPEYHALIIRGYTDKTFITNDPGTQFGNNFEYNYDDLMNAIRDWNDGEVKNGRKVILVVQ